MCTRELAQTSSTYYKLLAGSHYIWILCAQDNNWSSKLCKSSTRYKIIHFTSSYVVGTRSIYCVQVIFLWEQDPYVVCTTKVLNSLRRNYIIFAERDFWLWLPSHSTCVCWVSFVCLCLPPLISLYLCVCVSVNLFAIFIWTLGGNWITQRSVSVGM